MQVSVINLEPDTEFDPEPLLAQVPDSCFDAVHSRGFWAELIRSRAVYLSGFVKLIVLQDDFGVRGIIPLAFDMGDDPEFEQWAFLGMDISCWVRPPCPSQLLPYALPHFPAFEDWCTNQDYLLSVPNLRLKDCSEGGRFYLPDSFEAYVAGARQKVRQEWGRILRKNEDLRVVVTDEYIQPDFDTLIPGYAEYSSKFECTADISKRVVYTCELYEKWEQLTCSSCRFIYVYQGDKILAINCAINHGDGVLDTLCLRDMGSEFKPRSLGVLCVLLNIRDAISRGKQWYSMTPGSQGYKRQFEYGLHRKETYLKTFSEVDLLLGATDGYFKGVWVTEINLPNLVDRIPPDVRAQAQLVVDRINA
jgi:hypothetical protein